MPPDFLARHTALFDLFISKLTEAEKLRVFRAMLNQGDQK